MTETLTPMTVHPEKALAGSFLCLSAAEALDAARLVHVDDVQDEHAALIHHAALVLAAGGVAPDPVAVLAAVRERGVLAENNRLQLFAQAMIRYAEQCPHPLSARHYARLVVEDSYRRQVAAFGERCSQIAHTAPLDDVDANLREWVERLRETRRRLSELQSVAGAR